MYTIVHREEMVFDVADEVFVKKDDCEYDQCRLTRNQCISYTNKGLKCRVLYGGLRNCTCSPVNPRNFRRASQQAPQARVKIKLF